MSEELEPGLYRATVRGVPNVMVLIADSGFGHTIERYDYAGQSFPEHIHGSSKITDACPLIVLDLSGFISDELLIEHLRGAEWFDTDSLADQVEAQTKPPRIPEPLHWGSKVRTARATYVLLDIATLGRRWLDQHDGQLYKWDALADPVLVREGCC